MNRLAIVLIVMVMCLSVTFAATENFPPPEFESGYTFPEYTTPDARAQLFSIIDIIVLVAVMLLGAWFSIRKRSRSHVIMLVLFSLLYFGFYRKGCICAIGAIQNVALAIGDPEYVLGLVAGAFFALPLLFALFFGRVFCGSACPLGAVQDIVLLRPLRVPRWLEDALGLIPFVFLGVAALYAWTNTAFLICRYDPYIAFFRLGGSMPVVIAGVALVLVGMFVGRPYCRFICPYSALLRVCSSIARDPARITTHECITCHLCANSCPFGAIRPPTPENVGPTGREGRGMLVGLVIALPVIMAVGGWLGYQSSHELSRMNYTIQLAERTWAEQNDTVEGTTEQSDAFYHLGMANEGLYRRAAEIRMRFDVGSAVLGAYLGLVIGLKLIGLSIRRRRDVYEIDPAACFTCGRCYQVCPLERLPEDKAAETGSE